MAKETRPNVVILDVEMPMMGAQAALRRLLGLSLPPHRVIFVTVFADRRLVRELLGLGASALLVKSASSWDLIATVRSVVQNLHEGEDNVTVRRGGAHGERAIPAGDADPPTGGSRHGQ